MTILHSSGRSCRSWYIVIFALLFAAGGAGAEDVNLLVNLKEVRDAVGELRISLYRDPETFRKEDRALKLISVPATKGSVSLVFEGLPPGRYAIMAYHDENSDGKLNLRFGMFPLEGYGLSNNPKVMGPPNFSDSAFDVGGTKTSTDIRLTY